MRDDLHRLRRPARIEIDKHPNVHEQDAGTIVRVADFPRQDLGLD